MKAKSDDRSVVTQAFLTAMRLSLPPRRFEAAPQARRKKM